MTRSDAANIINDVCLNLFGQTAWKSLDDDSGTNFGRGNWVSPKVIVGELMKEMSNYTEDGMIMDDDIMELDTEDEE